jgi:hypothetical protein
MARKTITELQEELAAEREDNARLYAKVENMRAELAGDSSSTEDVDDSDTDSDTDDDTDSDEEDSDSL